MQDYSQYGEQSRILNYFNGKVGMFLDVGAYDGVKYSNSHALALAGWEGVLVEPDPYCFTALIKTYQDNPKMLLINSCLSTKNEPTYFYSSGGDALSSTEPEQVRVWAAHKFYKFVVNQMTIEALKTFCPSPNFINVDTEGTSVDLAIEMLKIYEPDMWCIEHDQQADRLEEAFKDKYDVLLPKTINTIFVRRQNEIALPVSDQK